MERINKQSWERREIYDFFSNCDWPFYSITIPVEVTKVKELSKKHGLSFYHLMLWVCTKALNSVPEFRVRIRGDELFRVDRADPSFVSMKKGEEVFRIISMPWDEDVKAFCADAERRVQTQTAFIEPQADPDAWIYYSCLPWTDFTALTNERIINRDDAIPRLTWGKYYEDKGGLWLHLSIEVNHRTIDGYHIGKLKEAIDRECEALAAAFCF